MLTERSCKVSEILRRSRTLSIGSISTMRRRNDALPIFVTYGSTKRVMTDLANCGLGAGRVLSVYCFG